MSDKKRVEINIHSRRSSRNDDRYRRSMDSNQKGSFFNTLKAQEDRYRLLNQTDDAISQGRRTSDRKNIVS